MRQYVVCVDDRFHKVPFNSQLSRGGGLLEWSKRGVRFTLPLQRPALGGVFCQFEDPDGNTFVLAGFDDATRQIEAGRRAYAEHLEAKAVSINKGCSYI